MRPRLLWIALILSLYSHHPAAAEEAGAPAQDSSDWHFVGPSRAAQKSEGVTIGRINAVAFDPVEPRTLYAGTPASGLWRTEDDGATWELLTGSLPRLGIQDIAIDPKDNKTIYILTGDGEGFRGMAPNPPSIGVKKSTDGGHTWQSTGLTFKPKDNHWGYRLVMDPTNPSILLAAMDSGLYRTTDGGKNWQRVLGPDEFFDVQFHPSDPSIVYAATGTNVHRSVDTGQTWDQLSGGLPQIKDKELSRIRLAVTPASPDTLYVLYGAESGFTVGLYRSDDRGETFTKRSSTDPLPKDPNAPPPISLTKPNVLGFQRNDFAGSQSSWYDLAMAVSPTNVDRVHVGAIDTWRSDDGGKTWTLTSRWTLPQDDPKYTHSDIHVLAYRYPRVVPSSGDVLYSGNDGGLYRSEDGGDSWINIANMKSGISSFQVYSVCGTPQDSNLLYFGAQDNGTWRLTLDAEGKEAGAKQVFGGDGMVCQINPKNSNIVFGSYIQGQLYRSDDGGKTFPWWPPRPLPLRRGEAQWLVPYILAPDDPRTIYLCSTDLWRGNERSYFRWENLTNGATGSSVNCNQVAVSPADPKTIYIAKAAARKVRQGQNPRAAPPFLGGGGVFRSTDGGMTWQSITGNLPVTEADISDLAVSLTDPRHVWVTFADRFGGVLPKAKVFGSVDGGATWTDLSAGLPEISVDTVTAENSPLNGIYVGTDDGVYYRDDKLGKFVPFKRGLPSGIVKSLLIDQNKHRLFAGTFVRGIWLTAIPCHENCSAGPTNPAPQ